MMRADGSERYRRGRRNKKRKGREKEKRRAKAEARWVLVMDEKKVQRETQTKKEEHVSFSAQRVLKMKTREREG